MTTTVETPIFQIIKKEPTHVDVELRFESDNEILATLKALASCKAKNDWDQKFLFGLFQKMVPHVSIDQAEFLLNKLRNEP